MNEARKTGFAERLKTAAEARQALLSQFKPKAAAPSPELPDRAAQRAAELQRVRQERSEAKAAKKQAAAEAELSARAAAEAIEAEALEAKRGQRKERKALSKAEAKAKRDARYAARKARH
jgi:hypothetical protein